MFRLQYILGFCLIWAVFTSSQKFPTDIERCVYSDSDCISKVVTNILLSHSKGHPGLNIIPFDPLRVESLVLGKSLLSLSPVNVDLKLTNVDLIGMTQATVLSVTGFTKEASDLEFEIQIRYPKLSLSGPYSIEGLLLALPINGQGNVEIACEDTLVNAKVKCNTRQEGGETYLNIIDAKLDIQPKKVTFNFGNLFNGNKALADNMNRLINQSWTVLYSVLKPLFETTFAKLGIIIANGTFSKIPYAELFLPS